MAALSLSADGIEARVSTLGGRVLSLDWLGAGNGRVPILCAAAEGAGAKDRSAFPLVPFGNRLAENAFLFGGRLHRLAANTADPFYLHGDGWLAEWHILEAGTAALTLGFCQKAGPYRYAARQALAIEDGAIRLTLTVENRGKAPMPFGMGWHPFLPRTPQARLQLRARSFRTEEAGHLPGRTAPLPADLDFAGPAPLPERWVNNALEDWDGHARILWPERGAALAMVADPIFAHAFLFVPDRATLPGREWFCLEPMTHRAGAHGHADGGGLVALSPGEALSGALRLVPSALPSGIASS
ncbi:aldose 1-epimerase [Aureimonas frigidaquae]|uniref:Galactose mutarotase-like enzyme n=1 Tax=Aureimonas frigidaquae TaxID=424757 RepID=A0A0P0Z3H7_9HYPH|nr:aldose 1-epimerase [Aureimonas frigidaquae]BAT28600.1 galactose mutarotase-like enzyme [Aureimonas frigidaquae]